MSSDRFDAVVIGAGPAGSATAILLARAGWSVALVERQRFPRRKVCGECIAASNIALLAALGIGDAFAREAGPGLTRVALMRGDATVEAPLPPGDDAAVPWGRALGRDRLDTLLAAAAEGAGVTLLQPWALQCIEGAAGDHRLVLHASGGGDDRGTRGLHAGLVVAAHGSWQPLRSERESRRRAKRPNDLFAFKANFRATRIAAGCLPVLSFAGGYGGMVVEAGGVATLACCVREDTLARARLAHGGERAGDAVEAMLKASCAGVSLSLQGAVRDGPWLASGPIAPGIRLGRGDGLFRVGNAAGEAHPIVGEGISMALQSAFVLASVIGGNGAPLTGRDAAAAQRAALLRYEALWRRRFAARLVVAAAFAHAAMRPALSPLLAGVVRQWPALLTHGARWAGKTRAVAEAAGRG